MATRWHEDDITGRALRLMAHEGWEVLNLPALAKDNDPLGRLPGEALWPARYDVPALGLRRQSVGEYEWAAKYDGEPRPSEGGIFKPAWFKPFVQVLPPIRFAVRYWDLAMSSRTAADYTVGIRLAECADGFLYITGIVREQVELADLPALLRDTMMGDGAGIRQGFENKGYMVRAIQDLVKDRQMRQYRIKGYEADTDKLTRALPLASQSSLSRVRVYVGQGGVSLAQAEALLDEMASFPFGTHDDQVDALAGALLMSSEGLPGKRSAEVLTNVY
jgi:predicted phage terminase large subunit-like protein